MATSNTNIAVKRIRREYSEVLEMPEYKRQILGVELVNDKWTHLKAFITGPPDTPYEGGKFHLDVKIPDSYPFRAPDVKFITHIWHPNISSQTGVICLDILNGDGWAAILTLRTILLSITALLAAPEADNPQDAVVAGQLKQTPKTFRKTAKQWTAIYAEGTHRVDDYDHKMKLIMEMGVTERTAIVQLSTSNWDVEKAINNI